MSWEKRQQEENPKRMWWRMGEPILKAKYTELDNTQINVILLHLTKSQLCVCSVAQLTKAIPSPAGRKDSGQRMCLLRLVSLTKVSATELCVFNDHSWHVPWLCRISSIASESHWLPRAQMPTESPPAHLGGELLAGRGHAWFQSPTAPSGTPCPEQVLGNW